MRKSAAILFLVSVAAFSAFAEATPESLLARGQEAFRKGDYTSAAVDLQAAAQGFLSPDQMQAYVNTGRFERLQPFETALVWLALAQFRLGREDDARETILRLVSAERIAPTYATLPLSSEAAEFETVVAALVPSARLPRNEQLAAADPNRPLPPVRPTTEEKVAVRKTLAQERAERQAAIDAFIAQERERIQREADARIAAEKAAAEKAAAERIAAAQREADQRVAEVQARANERVTEVQATTQERLTAAQTEARKRVAAAEAEAQRRVQAAEAEAQKKIAAAEAEARQRMATAEQEAQKQADARIAEIEKQTQERIAQERAASQQAATARLAEAEASARRVYLTSLRQAEAFANNGLLDDANTIYRRLANSENVPREVIAEAAAGLYRTGAFRDAVEAFRRMGAFARGEEDLRYYHAVALYEIGDYEAAKKELACALPFIQITDDVTRYRLKIEQSAAQLTAARK